MTKSSSLFAHGVIVLRNLLFLFAVLAATLYVFECFDAKKFPYMLTEEDLAKSSILGIWTSGLFGLIWIFLMIMEVLRRRNFNLETLNDENNNEPLQVWILKQAVVKIALVVVLLCSPLIFVPAGLMSLKDYWDSFELYWIIIPPITAVVWLLNIAGEIIKRRWRKFRAR